MLIIINQNRSHEKSKRKRCSASVFHTQFCALFSLFSTRVQTLHNTIVGDAEWRCHIIHTQEILSTHTQAL